MSVKLKENLTSILAKDLSNGQIATIVDRAYHGDIVQRIMYNDLDILFTIGSPGGKHWSNPSEVSLRVRVLKPGELIEIIEN